MIYWPEKGATTTFSGDDRKSEEPLGPGIHVKWMLDDCSTLSDAAQRLRAVAEEYEKAEEDGWRLEEPISDGVAELFMGEES